MCGFKKTGEDRFFMLLANERTGSTATMRLLSGHPEICGSHYDSRLFTNAFTWEGLFESAYINKLDFDIREVYRELDKAVLLAFLKFIAIKNQEKSTKNRKLYGLKCTFYNASLPMLKNMVRILKDTNRRVKIVHLTRDYFESYISWLVDKKTGRGRDLTDEERLETLSTRISFTEEQKQEYTDAAKERDNIIRSLSSYCPYLHIDYTTLYSNVEQGAKQILRFLNVSVSDDAVKLAIKRLNEQEKRLTMSLKHYIQR